MPSYSFSITFTVVYIAKVNAVYTFTIKPIINDSLFFLFFFVFWSINPSSTIFMFISKSSFLLAISSEVHL